MKQHKFISMPYPSEQCRKCRMSHDHNIHRIKIKKKSSLSCDVELGGVRDVATIMKFGIYIIAGGTVFYFLKKWGSFKFFANFGKNVKTIAKAPGEFTRAEGDVIDNAIFQANKALEMYKQKKGSDITYTQLIAEWNPLKTQALKAQTEKVGFFKFYGSGKSNKELMANRIQVFVNKVIGAIKISGISGLDTCLPCLPLIFL